MKIQNNFSHNIHPSFGIKVNTKTALEAATNMFLDDCKISYPRQTKLLSELSSLDIKKLYSGEMAEGLRGMSKVIKNRHPEINESAARIKKECNALNMERTFLPEDEVIFKEKLDNIVNEELKKIGKREIDIEPISLKELGLEKYENIL